jgi:hypothetical protein
MRIEQVLFLPWTITSFSSVIASPHQSRFNLTDIPFGDRCSTLVKQEIHFNEHFIRNQAPDAHHWIWTIKWLSMGRRTASGNQILSGVPAILFHKVSKIVHELIRGMRLRTQEICQIVMEISLLPEHPGRLHIERISERQRPVVSSHNWGEISVSFLVNPPLVMVRIPWKHLSWPKFSVGHRDLSKSDGQMTKVEHASEVRIWAIP